MLTFQSSEISLGLIQTFKMNRSDAAVAGVEARTLQIVESPYYRSGEIKFTWTIKDFLKRPERKGQSFASPSFTIDVADVGKTTWKLDLAPKGKDKRGNEDWISIFLMRHMRGQGFSVLARFTISLLDASSNETRTLSLKMPDSAFSKPDGGSWGKTKWMKAIDIVNNQELLLHDGDLKLVCQVTVEDEDRNLPKDCVNQVLEQFESLFTDREFSDVEIQCGGQVFYCHQAILATRSQVFKAMFQANMKEKETRTVSVEEIAPEVLGEMLKFIYTGTLSSNNQLSYVDLLGAAEQYQLELLKKVCEKKLCGTITIQNCLEYLGLGDLYPTPELKTCALQFIAKNMATIVKTEEYKKFLQNNADLALKITEAMIEKKTGDQSRQLVTSRPQNNYGIGLSGDGWDGDYDGWDDDGWG